MSNYLYSKEAEDRLLGLLLKKPNLLFKVSGKLKPEDFKGSSFNEYLYNIITQLWEEKKTFTIPNVVEKLKQFEDLSSDEWDAHITDLITSKGIEENIDQYITLIIEKSNLRKYDSLLNEHINKVATRPTVTEEEIKSLETAIFNLTKENQNTDFKNVSEITEEFIAKQTSHEGEMVSDIKTGIYRIDEKLNGFQKGDFIIIAGRPSMGKTAFSLELMNKISDIKRVAFFSLEMPKEQIIQRLLVTLTETPFQRIKDIPSIMKNQLDYTNLKLAIEKLKVKNFYIDDRPGQTIDEIVWKARKLHNDKPIDLLVIDYLQLITTSGKNTFNRQEEISKISNSLKNLARELKIPVIALSQLSRRVEQRDDKRPLMSDIRESGAIEQDADIIMFLYRKAYYEQKQNQFNNSQIEQLEVIISKHRNGPTGTVMIGFKKEFGKITSGGNLGN